MPDITILATPNAAGASLFGVMELFSAANRIICSTGQPSALFNTTLCSLAGTAITTSEGITISVKNAIEDTPRADLLYIAPPSISSDNELEQQSLQWHETVSWLASEHHRFDSIASHCCGSFLLAQCGLLDGGGATTAWWLSELLATRHPEISVDPNAIIVRSGKCITAAGTGAYQDMALDLLRQLAGTSISRLTAKYLMADRQRRSQSAYRLDLADHSQADALITQARVWIKKNLANDFKIDELASALHTSPRTLLRRFQEHSGNTPQALVQSMRIERSKVLFETTNLAVDAIARRCGYRDESAFRRVFKRYCGLSPREYRLRFSAKHGYRRQTP